MSRKEGAVIRKALDDAELERDLLVLERRRVDAEFRRKLDWLDTEIRGLRLSLERFGRIEEVDRG